MGWQQSPTNGWDKSPRWGRLGWEGRASSISVRLVSVGAVRAGATCKRSRSGWHTGGNSAFSAPCFLPVLPPRASPLLLTAHFASGASGHQMRGGFHLYQAILCATSRASCNLTQFRCHLSGGSARSRRRRAQSHETAPHFRCQLQAVGPQVTHSFRPTWSQIGVPTTLFSG